MNLFKKNYLKEWKSFIDYHKKTLIFTKGETIFNIGEMTKGLYVIESGHVKITYKKFDGDHLLIRIAGKDDIIGHRGFGGDWKYPISAFALKETSVSFIPIEIFKTLAKTNPIFSFEMMMFFADELRNSENRISQPPVISRIAYTLVENHRVFGFESGSETKLSFTLSRSDISSMAGTTYESVIRSLSELKKMNVIQLEGKSIHIKDLNGLIEIANPG